MIYVRYRNQLHIRLNKRRNGLGVEMSSIWRFKGFDRPAVIITDLTPETSDVLRFVGTTRVRSVLKMVGTEEALNLHSTKLA